MVQNKYNLLLLLLLIAGAISYGIAYMPEVTMKDADLSVIPYSIGEWKGVNTNDETVPDLTKRIHATNILYRIYTREGAAPVTVFVSTCKSLKKHPEFKYHFPKYCYVGSGWQIVQEADIPVQTGDAPPFHARELVLRKDEHTMVTVFYFQTRRHVKLTPGIRQRLHDLINRCVFRRSDITVVRVSTTIGDMSVQDAAKRIKEFLKAFDPVLTKTLEEIG